MFLRSCLKENTKVCLDVMGHLAGIYNSGITRNLLLCGVRLSLRRGERCGRPIFMMTAAPSNADVRRADLDVYIQPALMSAFVYEPRTAGEPAGLTELAGIGRRTPECGEAS